MIRPKDHVREKERLKELDSFAILDTLPEEDFDSLTTIAASICGTPISLISLLDGERQWFKSHHGLDVDHTPKELAFCAHAINAPENVFEIEDARKDERFHDNPLVTGNPHVIFYAGVPLVTEKGLPLGTLCVIDDKPRKLESHQVKSLNALSKQVMRLFELRKKKLTLEKTLKDLEESNQNLERFATLAAHDLKSPLNNISMLADLFLDDYGKKIDEEGNHMLDMIKTSSVKLKKLIEGLLAYSKSDSYFKENKNAVILSALIDDISDLHHTTADITIELKSELTAIQVNRTILYHVLLNLISNAIKYNDKDKIIVKIEAYETKSHYVFSVNDNGPGIAPQFKNKIFELFSIMNPKDRFGQTGSGIGLATVKKLIENSGGFIQVDSEIGNGSTFRFSLEK